MKLFSSLPNSVIFYEKYAHLVHSLSKVAIICQTVTGLCEVGIITALIKPTISDLAPSVSNSLSVVLAVCFASILQIGLKKVFPFSVRSILHRRFSGLDLPFTIVVFFLTASLLIVSIFLSYKGSQDIGTLAVTIPAEKSTSKFDSDRAESIKQSNTLFSIDSLQIENRYVGMRIATNTDYALKIAEIERYSNGRKATMQRAQLQIKLAQQQTDRAKEITNIASERKATIQAITARTEKLSDEVLSDNKNAITTAKTKQKQYGGYIGYFTLFCYAFFLSVLIMKEIFDKGSEIITKPLTSQRHHSASIFAEFTEAIKERVDVYFRTKIIAFSDKTKAQPLPAKLSALYDHEADLMKSTLKITTEKSSDNKTISLPIKRHKIAASTEADSKPQRQTIGFKTASAETNDGKVIDGKNDVITASVINGKNRACAFCNQSFQYSIHNQKYCSEEHRKLAWQQKTGKAFDLDLKNKTRSRTK